MKLTFAVLLIMVVMILSSMAAAKEGTTTADELRKQCRAANTMIANNKDDGHAFDVGLCFGYIEAFRDATLSLREYSNDKPFKLVNDDGISLTQTSEMFVKYMDEHPEDLHANAGMMIGVMLLDTQRARLLPDNSPTMRLGRAGGR